ncbi:uroporphyrinogen-III synthase [Metarhizium album ARSEF 1941]|uniref:Uroporphyrinogen-III synthase n=1 Tax=Metarhizium album (strain ARSEF 1941) TaxID=1081103 RepID=A0A0B2X5P7_METAS|nr:uroporphyrinogen-III synthase [Metarhizium album ARSEF 1941]KHO01093.1 uroporphyrinogen-III synthase [Metarhizium album ARSEF 1941]
MASQSLETKPGHASSSTVPILLLKTRSTPSDAYEEALKAAQPKNGPPGRRFDPQFVPVLRHRLNDSGIQKTRSLLQANEIGDRPGCKYGGMIFTSQRAVEAFAKVVNGERERSGRRPFLQNTPIYSVGPATTRALSAIQVEPPLQIFGQHTGSGEALAAYILEHYGHWYRDREVRPPLLFLVGEQRRDVIPRVLMNPSLPRGESVIVDEEVVYGTGLMESFSDEFQSVLSDTQHESERWVVVFSPTGCDTMLRGLGLLNESDGRVDLERRDGKTFIATIGPTTRACLVTRFGFEPDVCADSPSPDGILHGITKFTTSRA